MENRMSVKGSINGQIVFELPRIKDFEKVCVRLSEPRVIVHNDGRKPNPNRKTLLPLSLKDYEKQGVYLIVKDEKVIYVGATKNLFERMANHPVLKKNDIKFIYFLETNDRNKKFVYEILYKYHFFGEVKPEYMSMSHY